MKLQGNDAYLFCRLLYEINQDFKEKESLYTIKDGVFMNFKKDRLSLTSAEFVGVKKEEYLEKYFEKLNCCMDGIAYFVFFGNYKKNIVEVEILKKYFIIRTDVPEVSFESRLFNPEVDYNEFKRFMEKVDIDNINMNIREELDKDLVLKISKSKYPVRFTVGKAKVPLIVTYKLFPGIKKDTKMTVMCGKMKGGKYLVRTTQDQKKYKSETYFVVQKY